MTDQELREHSARLIAAGPFPEKKHGGIHHVKNCPRYFRKGSWDDFVVVHKNTWQALLRRAQQ